MGLPHGTVQPGESPSSPDLKPDPESLADFKKALDTVLQDLDKSYASHSKLSDQTVTHTSYGDFDEARTLASTYDSVHDTLKTLAQAWGDQIEALGICVDMANRGYQGVDEEHRDRLRVLQARMQQFSAQQSQTQAQDASLSNGGQGSTNNAGGNSRSMGG
ncbi:hypothetical protein ACFOSC_04770 [Streptantibioticus rubrisoli]|uniref:Uncharacterized protein n=1 Tax=Streptantibioticus rubrisoli TaxID=1387313 RepID=A0ABT1PEC9_9ACTN|nr:hypothetical protein [Streptantibioticus rubrisoli]MCQ4043679.1 hypothetical protein [Streptantibioticus rubrisoli]